MARTLKQLDNNIRIKRIIRTGKFYLYYGNSRIFIDGVVTGPYDTFKKAVKAGKNLRGSGIKRLSGKSFKVRIEDWFTKIVEFAS